MRLLPAIPVLLLGACAAPADSDPAAEWERPAGGVVTLTTRDAVTLEADYQPAERAGAPAIVLLHMVPPSNNRAGWPAAFREALAAEGYTVLNVDRRGAGGSGGVAEEAYFGDKGKWDVEAATLKLRADGYGPLVIFGASNGTTSMVDYTVWASAESLPAPVALAYLSGGAYTEAQNPMASVPRVPMAFLYPPAEAAWSEGQRALDPGTWSFTSYPGGDHGTRLFQTSQADAVQADLIAFARAHAAP